MKKKMLWKDIFKSISKSKGRFVSIICLMLLGSFALVGLKVTGPDMRDTGETYFSDLNTADLTVIGTLGIDENDEVILNQINNRQIEYGYLKDVVIKNSTDSIRIFSQGDRVSDYELKKGRLPISTNEIAIDETYKDKYEIGDDIFFTEKEDATGKTVLKVHEFKVVGYIYSGEIISNVNLGQSTAGTGSLKGYGVVKPEVFDSSIYMLARLTFDDTKNVNPYSDDYTNIVQKHKKEIEKKLSKQPAERLKTIKEHYENEINQAQERIDEAKTQIATNQKDLDEAKKQLDKTTIEISSLNNQLGEAGQTNQSLIIAKEELELKTKEYNEKNNAFKEKKKEAETDLIKKEDQLNEAKEALDNLEKPVYSVNTRRDIPGGDGYRIYSSVSLIIDSLANVFPIFMYFVAALVTFTTMTRFVDEERINAGTLKALGYTNQDVMKKFTFYGLSACLLGSVLGIILGHTLFPMIVYHAYSDGFSIPQIERHIHWQVTLLALLLAVLSAVLPAWIVSIKETKETPSQLLLPKPPSNGSKILLERIPFIWNKLSFTHKVTARNIFRYKKRMLMTIFGVAGAVSLLFAGLSVQHSISGINDRQFGELIHYDVIVAKNDYLSEKQRKEIITLLKKEDVSDYAPVHYEEVTKVAGKNKDTQSITLIVPEKESDFSQYISLKNRQSHQRLNLPKDGVIISERLAKLLDVKVGDRISVKDSKQQNHEMIVSGITEMYMGHFMFTSVEAYESLFNARYTSNAYLLNLKEDSVKNTEKQAAIFMSLFGVKGVVQNTTLTNQILTIVQSLNKIMKILIIVAVLLAIVILYNLTNINVSERIRELSTIKVLGFYDNEVTMYIYRETILLTFIGILTGFGVGSLLHQYIITVVPPDDVMFNPTLSWVSFIVPLVMILIVTIILGFVINRRLKHVDMLEALKSVD